MDDFDIEDNVFDSDDALDYITSEEVEKEDKAQGRKTGCLGLIVILCAPAFLLSVSSLIGRL